MIAPKKRKVLARHGSRGRWVRVFLERGHQRITVQWRVAPAPPDQRSFAATSEQKADALAFAEGVAQRLRSGAVAGPSSPLTLQQMWDKYKDAEFPHLRPRTRELYEENYRRWCVHFGWEFIAERTTPEMADSFRKSLTESGKALKTIRNSIDDVKRVFLWAETRELLQRNRLRLYRFKVAKEDRTAPPAEYQSDDFAKILAQLDPSNPWQWRPWVALAIAGTQGARQNAVLHLTPDDITPERVRWDARWDKLGREWTQPTRPLTLHAKRVATEWRARRGYVGPWLIPSAKQGRKGEPYTAQSLWKALQDAEKRAGIPKIKGRAGHGLRRMLAGDVAAATGNALLALRSIGDRDVRMADRYVQGRDDEMRGAFGMLDKAPEGIAKAGRKRDEGKAEGATDSPVTPATPNRGT